MLPRHLFGGDKGNGGIVFVEVVGHGDNGFFNGGFVRAFLCHHIDLAAMLLPCGQLRHGAAAHRFQRLGYGNGVLPRVGYALNTAHRVAVALTDAAAPEGVILSFGQNDGTVEPGEGKHARIPAAGNQRHMAAFLCGGVHVGKMLRDAGVGVKAVHHIDLLCQCRRHLRQICGASAADDKHVKLICPGVQLGGGIDRSAGQGFDKGGIAPREHAVKLRVAVLGDGALHAASDITVTIDCKFHGKSSFPM